jgi:hypothetical protein
LRQREATKEGGQELKHHTAHPRSKHLTSTTATTRTESNGSKARTNAYSAPSPSPPPLSRAHLLVALLPVHRLALLRAVAHHMASPALERLLAVPSFEVHVGLASPRRGIGPIREVPLFERRSGRWFGGSTLTRPSFTSRPKTRVLPFRAAANSARRRERQRNHANRTHKNTAQEHSARHTDAQYQHATHLTVRCSLGSHLLSPAPEESENSFHQGGPCWFPEESTAPPTTHPTTRVKAQPKSTLRRFRSRSPTPPSPPTPHLCNARSFSRAPRTFPVSAAAGSST